MDSLRIDQSETRIFKAVFPDSTNHYDTLFGGTAMQLMDEVAFIAATRYTRKKVVTVSSDKIDFAKAIPSGTIIELIGRVAHVGNTSLKVAVEFSWKICIPMAGNVRFTVLLPLWRLTITKSR